MKNFPKKLITLILSASLLAGLTAPAAAAGYDPIAEKISTPITIDNAYGRPVEFCDIDDGATKNRTPTEDPLAFYRAAVTHNSNLWDWVCLSYQIFKSQNKSYWDHAGNGWDKDFGQGHYMDFARAMLTKTERRGGDGMASSGLSVANSLEEVQERAVDEVASLIDRQLTGKDFMKRHKMDSISKASDDSPVLYTSAACIDRYGYTPQFGYSTFTIAFYDFKLHVLSDENPLPSKVLSQTSDTEETFLALTENAGLTDITASSTLANSVSSSISSSISESESYRFGQSIGLSYSLTQKLPTGSESTVGYEASVSFEEAISTAYSTTESLEESKSMDVTVTKTVPAHTKETGRQELATTTMVLYYDCPVALTYKVAVFSMCGTCYDDDALIQSFSTAGYEQRTFATFFGEGTDASDSVESLYQRAVNHRDDTGYDQSFGKTLGINDDGDVWCKSLNWKKIVSMPTPKSSHYSELSNSEGAIGALVYDYPMSLTGASTILKTKTISTYQGEARPMYPISTIYIPWQLDEDWSLSRTFNLNVGEQLPITSYRLEACDKDSVPYHGFVSTLGYWQIVDANGQPVSSDVAEMTTDPITGAQTLTAKAAGETYVKYFIRETDAQGNYTYVTCDDVPSLNENISSAAYKVVVTEAPAEPFTGTLILEGSLEPTLNKTINLNGEGSLQVTAYDPTGKEVEPDVTWEAQELESKGISVDPDGTMTATRTGTFHIRARMGDVCSDWLPITVKALLQQPLSICYHPFHDVLSHNWCNPAVEFVYQEEIMAGVKAHTFRPDGQVTRAQVAQVLYNLENTPDAAGKNPFSDVQADDWFANAVIWAAETGLTTGVKADRFDPNAPVTREELVTFLCRYADWKAMDLPQKDVDLASFEDADQISAWAESHVIKALAAGIIQGESETRLAPQGTATRAELAQILFNLLAE